MLMFFGAFKLGPLNAICIAKILILHNSNRTGRYFVERLEVEGHKRSLDDVQRSEVIGERTSANDFQVAEVLETSEVFVVTLDVEEPGDLLQGAKNLKSVRVHLVVCVIRGEVVDEDVSVALEGCVEDGYGAFNNGAVFKTVDVAGMYNVDSLAGFRTGSVARYTFSVHSLLFRRTSSNTRAVVLQQMFRTVSHACCTVSVFSVRVCFPGVRRWVVPKRKKCK